MSGRISEIGSPIVSSKDVHSLFLVEDLCLLLAKKCFNAIAVFPKYAYPSFLSENECENVLIMKDFEKGQDLREHIDKFLLACGETIHKLRVRCSYAPWIPRVASHAVNLKELLLDDVEEKFQLNELLASCPKLESLEYIAETVPAHHISAIAQHCSGLQKFSFWPQDCENNLVGMWKSIGQTLEHLETFCWFFYDVDKDDDENVMKKFCTRLKILKVKDVVGGEDVNVMAEAA